MKIRKARVAWLAGAALMSAGTAIAAPAAPPTPRYVYFTLYTNLVARLSPRQELLELPLDLDLKQVTRREALRQIFAQAKQDYLDAGDLPEVTRITLHGKGILLSDALDELARQAGGAWMQELNEGKPRIWIGRESPMTIHLPATPELLQEIARLRGERSSREPTDEEIQQLVLRVVAAGRAQNIPRRRGLRFRTTPQNLWGQGSEHLSPAPPHTAHGWTTPRPSRTVTTRSTPTFPSFSTRPLDHRTSTSSTFAALPSPNRQTPSLALQ
jgi:hypothetical protein